VIPTTITGIVILLLLVLPGFVFVTLRERHQPARKLSVLRETSAVLAATLGAYLVPFVATVVVALIWSAFRADLASALGSPTTYESVHPFRTAVFVVAWVLAGAAVACLLGSRWVGRRFSSEGGSAWWKMFEPAGLKPETYDVEVTATLTDGSTITGTLYSWSRDGEDTPDRELVLQQPLWIQPASSTKVKELGGATMSISARNARTIAVRYIMKDGE
jgi:hypothetical protein